MLSSLLHCFRTNFLKLDLSQPTVLALSYYPVRIVLGEWNLYIHLTSRYFKYYEYSINDIGNVLRKKTVIDITDLQRWRRRSKQSQYKLALLADFIEHWLDNEANKKPWLMIGKDIQHVQRQMELFSQSLEQMITVATSMVQLVDSRLSIQEAVSVRGLTYIALLFIPLSWVASLFSMDERYLPGNELFWVYFATGLPLVILVLLLSALPHDKLTEVFKRQLQRTRAARIQDGRLKSKMEV
ncbi:hypothetical protein ACHAPT_008639 [Fusarium lateritium]